MGSYSSFQWSLIFLCNFPFVDLLLSLPRVIYVGFTDDWAIGENTSPGNHHDFPPIPQLSEPWTLVAVQMSWHQLPNIVPLSIIIRISPLPLVPSELGQALVFFPPPQLTYL